MRGLASGLLLAAIGCLSGCMAAGRMDVAVDDLDLDIAEEYVAREYVFDTNLPPEEILSGANAGSTRELLLKAPPGSQVIVYDDSNRSYMGTLLRADAETLELKSCVCKEVIPGPDGQQQCKTSFIPFQSLSMPSLTNFRLISWPQSSVASDDSGDLTVDAIVFKSGRRQTWGKPPEVAASKEQTGTASVDTE
jgi:hypothetical protein